MSFDIFLQRFLDGEAADADGEAEMAVMPVGCRTAVTEPGLIDELPAGSPRAAVVTSGADILATVENA